MERKRHLKIGISSYTDTHTVLGVTGNAEFSGIVTALEFHGDGSNLTNITADAGSYATTAGFATVAGYAHTAGIATVAEGLTGIPDINVGVATASEIHLDDNQKATFGDGDDLQIYHNGTQNIIDGNATTIITGNWLYLRKSVSGEDYLICKSDGAVELFYDDSKKFETSGIGVTVTGQLDSTTLNVSGVSTFQSTVSINDNVTLALGAGTTGGALQLFQTGSSGDGRIRNRVGDLQIQEDSGSIVFKKGLTAEKMAEFATDGAVDLYYDNSKKFETTQSGIIVTGIATADGFVGPLEGNVTGNLTGDVNAGVITAVTGNFTGNVTIGGTLTYEDVTNVDSIGIVTARDGIVVNTRGIHVLSGITTLQDLDAQDLNIRNITGVAATFTESVSLYDNDKIFLGTSQEMEIFHGTLGNSFFTSTKPLYIKYGEDGQTHEMFIQNDSTTAAKFTNDASVELYYNGGKRLETVGGGVTVTGDLRVSGVVTATRFESTSSGTPSIDSPNNLDLNAINVAVSTDMSVGRNLTVVGFVSAANFYGDGSGLTNLPSSSYAPNAGVATYAQTAGIATLAENLTGSPAITISSATVGSGSNLSITPSNIYRSNADLTLTGGGPQSSRCQLILSNGGNVTLKANDSSGNVLLKSAVGSVQVVDSGITTSTPFLRAGAAGTVRLDRGDGNFTGVVTATTFYGDFQGTGSGISGANAETVSLTATNTASGFHYLTFVDTATGNENLRTDTGLRYVPETGELNIIGGNLTANSATLGSISASGLAGIGSLNVTGVSTFRDKVVINRTTTNEGLRFEYNGGYKGGLTAASAEFRVTSNGSNDLLLGSNNAGGTNGDVVIASVGAGNSYSTGWGRMAVFGGTGTAELYYQDVKKFEVTGVGATVFGTTQTQQLNVSGVSTFNDKVAIGTDVVSNSGKLHFATADGYINRASISVGNPIIDYGLYVVDSTSNANSNLHQNYVRQATSGNYSVSVGATNAFRVSNNDGSSSSTGNPGGMLDSDVAFVVNPDTSTELRYNYDKKLETTGVGATVFGTTQTQQLNVSGVATFQSNVNLGQNDKLLFNGTNGLEIYENGTVGVIQANNNSGRITIEVNNTTGSNTSSELIQFRGSGNLISANFKPFTGVELYGATGANSSEVKLKTTSIGATVFGTLNTQQLNVSGVSTFIDGGNGEIKVYEDSGDPIIEKTGGGSLHFKTNNGFDIEDDAGNLIARYGSGGGGVGDGVSLYHNAIERVATTNAGVVVTGILTATSYRGDGSQLTGVLAASEAGISIQDDQSAVGVSTTIDFGTGLSVSPVSAGVVTVTSGASAGISPVIAGMIF